MKKKEPKIDEKKVIKRNPVMIKENKSEPNETINSEYRKCSCSGEYSTKIYYLVKKGVYDHGIYWIGTDIQEGIRQADIAAKNDIDDHHRWILKEYKPVQDVEEYSDPCEHNHRIEYETTKTV